jgi:hypothetical protein
MSWWMYPIIAVGSWFAFWFLRGAYWAAIGRPMPPKPPRS